MLSNENSTKQNTFSVKPRPSTTLGSIRMTEFKDRISQLPSPVAAENSLLMASQPQAIRSNSPSVSTQNTRRKTYSAESILNSSLPSHILSSPLLGNTTNRRSSFHSPRNSISIHPSSAPTLMEMNPIRESKSRRSISADRRMTVALSFNRPMSEPSINHTSDSILFNSFEFGHSAEFSSDLSRFTTKNPPTPEGMTQMTKLIEQDLTKVRRNTVMIQKQ